MLSVGDKLINDIIKVILIIKNKVVVVNSLWSCVCVINLKIGVVK